MRLLDFDGVIVRNPRVSAHVSRACVRYMAKKASISIDKARDLNRTWYPELGHSSRVLQERLGIPCTVQEFNDAVYTEFIEYDQIKYMLVATDFLHANALIGKGHDCAIFSNAPSTWCRRMLGMLQVDHEPRLVIGSDTIGHVLKPSMVAYGRVEKLIGGKPGVFVDDDLQNVTSATRLGWNAVYFHKDMTAFDLS